MRPSSYVVAYIRVLLSLGLYGWFAFLVSVAFGIGMWADYLHIRTIAEPIYKRWLGADMPTTLPWIFITAAFVIIALFRLVHRHVSWEATLPRLTFSSPQLVWATLNWGTPPHQESNSVAIGYVEVSNRPLSAVDGKAAESAWATATFKNLKTGQERHVRFCRWTDNPKPRSDEHTTTLPVRYKSEWNYRTLEPNGAPNRLDFFLKHLGGNAYGLSGPQQESIAWRDDANVLWAREQILVTLKIEAKNLICPATTSFILDLESKDGIEFRGLQKRL